MNFDKTKSIGFFFGSNFLNGAGHVALATAFIISLPPGRLRAIHVSVGAGTTGFLNIGLENLESGDIEIQGVDFYTFFMVQSSPDKAFYLDAVINKKADIPIWNHGDAHPYFHLAFIYEEDPLEGTCEG